MTRAADAQISIGQVSEQTGLSVHTLRFYEQQDLLIDPVVRDAGGRRIYREKDISWLRICSTLRDTGMPIADIQHYVALARQGPTTVTQRHALLRTQADRVRQQIAALQQALAVINRKADTYGNRIVAEGPARADRSWESSSSTPAQNARPARHFQ